MEHFKIYDVRGFMTGCCLPMWVYRPNISSSLISPIQKTEAYDLRLFFFQLRHESLNQGKTRIVFTGVSY